MQQVKEHAVLFKPHSGACLLQTAGLFTHHAVKQERQPQRAEKVAGVPCRVAVCPMDDAEYTDCQYKPSGQQIPAPHAFQKNVVVEKNGTQRHHEQRLGQLREVVVAPVGHVGGVEPCQAHGQSRSCPNGAAFAQ